MNPRPDPVHRLPAAASPSTPPEQRRSIDARREAVCITSAELFAGATEVHIEHGGTLYRLQRTSLGKLILTK